IDIGGLNGVVMSNVPPGRTNYLQRAGRAGRRSDGTALVLTMASRSPYDAAVFADVHWYFTQELRRPRILSDRARVVRRQVHAWLLARFMQSLGEGRAAGAMHAYGRMGDFAGRPVPGRWSGGASQPPTAPPP